MSLAVELRNVSKTIKGNKVLDAVNLQLEEGKVYGFFGRNASGKTMLFRAVAGLVIPDEGFVRVLGKNLTENRSFPDDMGLVIENISLWGHLTGYENLELLASVRRVATREDIRDALERVGLQPDDNRRVKAYSLGMRQKLSLAQAIMERPRILVLDEPTNSLDDEAVERFQKIICEEKERGTTCLLASHQVEDIRSLC